MRYVFCLTLGVSLAMGNMAFAQDMKRDSVEGKLFFGEKQLKPWADELENVLPETLAEAWDALEVLLRAERDEAALRLMPHIYTLVLKDRMSEQHDAQQETDTPSEQERQELRARLQQRQITRGKQGQAIKFLCDLPAERLKLCLAFFEVCDKVFTPARDLTETLQKMGWDNEQIMDWMSARFQSALTMEAQEDERYFLGTAAYLRLLWPMSSTARNWQFWHSQYLSKSPRRDDILLRIMEEARQAPDDMKKLAIFLAYYENYYPRLEPKNADWLFATAERRSPIEAWVIAKTVKNIVQENATKETFLKRALSKPLTTNEIATFRKIVLSRSSAHIWEESLSDELLQVMFRVEALDELNKIYLQSNLGDAAQRVMLEARELRKKHQLRAGSFVAGQTQLMSGFRVVENEIKEREKLDEAKPEYWLERAEYYRGRNEPKEREDAYRRVLAFCDVAELRRDNPIYHSYARAYQELFSLLKGGERNPEAIELFQAQRAADLLEVYFSDEEWLYREIRDEMTEDLRHAYNWLKTTPKDESRDYRRTAHYNLYRLTRQPVATIRFGVMDFENDPFAWDVLAMINHPYDFGKYVYFLLFPQKLQIAYEYRVNGIQPVVDNRQPARHNHYVGCLLNNNKEMPDEKALLKLKNLVNRNLLSVNMIYQGIYEVLQKEATDYETLNWFLLTAINQAKHDWEKGTAYRSLIDNYLAMGDWQNSEKYIILVAERGNVRIDALRQTADLAEKAGAAEDARRIRERIKDIGVRP